jgi:hypothetical protein
MSYELSTNIGEPMTTYKPINYKIHLNPDLVNFTFNGTTEILFEAPQPTEEIGLDLLEITIRCWKME